jgi:hypothetical protein
MIGGLLASGGLVTIAAILRCYFAIAGKNQLEKAILWTVRESVSHSRASPSIGLLGKLIVVKFVAIFAVNLSAIRPLFSSSKWIKSSPQQSQSNYTPRRNTIAGSLWLSSSGSGQTDTMEFTSTEIVGKVLQPC